MKSGHVLFLSSLLCGSLASAALITTQPTGTTTVLTTVTGTWASASSVVAGGFTVDAPSGEQVWYGDSSYGLVGNGSWGDFAWVGGYCFSGSCTATINLGGLYSAVGGFMNYVPGGGATITALASDGVTVLESYDLDAAAPIVTPNGFNAGAFRGISLASPQIGYFRISNSYLIMHDITVGSEVPEPGTFAVAGLAFLTLAGYRKYRS